MYLYSPDFGEDEHIDHEVAAAGPALDFFFQCYHFSHILSVTVQPRIQRLYNTIAMHLSDSHRGERMRTGASLAIVGR